MVSVSNYHCPLLSHTNTHNPRLTGLFVTEVWRPSNRDILAYCVYPGCYSDIEQNTHTHLLYRKERLTDRRPRLLEGPFFECGYTYVFDCTPSVSVCVWLSLGLIRTKHNQQQRAAGCIRVRGRQVWVGGWVLKWNSVSFFLCPPFLSAVCIHSLCFFLLL